MLSLCPGLRPTCEAIKGHAFFAGVDWAAVEARAQPLPADGAALIRLGRQRAAADLAAAAPPPEPAPAPAPPAAAPPAGPRCVRVRVPAGVRVALRRGRAGERCCRRLAHDSWRLDAY
jgi:hypothetical protein